MTQKKLFDQFPPVSRSEWMDKIRSDLKGADFSSRLVWKTGEGFDIMPFYRREDLENLYTADVFLPLFSRGDAPPGETNRLTAAPGNPWLVRQDIMVLADYREANKKALDILMKGVDSLGFIIDDPESIGTGNFLILLDGIDPAGAEINFFTNGKAREIISSLADVCDKRGIDRKLLRGAVEADPIWRLLKNGTLCIPVDAGFDYLAELTEETATFPNYRNIRITGSYFNENKAGTVKELALSISMAAEYLSRLTERGISASSAASKIKFSFGIGPDYFMEIAKLRAARILWALIAGGYEASDKGSFRMEIHSVTRIRYDKVSDPYINMLRTLTGAMSAVLEGTDSLTVKPYDAGYASASEFSERIARNEQLLLKEEAWFDKVADPSAGSYYIENLTALIAERAWKQFVEIEEMGGFISALNKGNIIEKAEHRSGNN